MLAAAHRGAVVWLRPPVSHHIDPLCELERELSRRLDCELAAKPAIEQSDLRSPLLRTGAASNAALSQRLVELLSHLNDDTLVLVDDFERLDEGLAAALLDVSTSESATVVIAANEPLTGQSWHLPQVSAQEVGSALSQADGGRTWSANVCARIAEYVGDRRASIWSAASHLICSGLVRQTLDEVDSDEPADKLLAQLTQTDKQGRDLPQEPGSQLLLAHLMLSGDCAPGKLGDPAPADCGVPVWVQQSPHGQLRIGAADRQRLRTMLPPDVIDSAARVRVPWLLATDVVTGVIVLLQVYTHTDGRCDLRQQAPIEDSLELALKNARFRDAVQILQGAQDLQGPSVPNSWLAMGLRAYAGLGRFEGHGIDLSVLCDCSDVQVRLALAEYSFHAGEYGRCESVAEQVLSAEQTTSELYQAALLWRCFARVWQGRLALAMQDIELSDSGDERFRQAFVEQFTYLKGLCAYYQGHLDEAAQTFETLEVQSAHGAVAAAAAAGMGLVFQRRAELGAARDAYGRSRGLAQRAGDRARSLNMTMNIATLEHEQGELGLALAGYDVVLLAAERLGNTGAVTRCLINRGNALSLLGAQRAARADLTRAFEGLEQSGDVYLSGHVCTQLAELARKEGHLVSAHHWIQSALDRLHSAQAPSELQEAYLEQGWLHLTSGQLDEADALAKRCAGAAEELKSAKLRAQAAHLLGRTALQRWEREPSPSKHALLEQAAQQLDLAAELLPPSKRLAGLVIETDRAVVYALRGRGSEAQPFAVKQLQLVGRMTSGMSEQRKRELALSEAGRIRSLLLHVMACEQPAALDVGPMMPNNALSAVVALNQRLSAEHDTDRLLAVLMDSAIALTGAERGFLLIDSVTSRPAEQLPRAEELEIAVARNLDRENLTKPSHKLSHSIALEVFERGEPVLSIDAQSDPRFQGQHSVHSGNLRSIMSVPMNLRGRTMGVLYVDNRFTSGAFSRQQAVVLEALAAQAAIALHTARLIERYRRSEVALASSKSEVETLNAQLQQRLESTTDALSEARQALAAARDMVAERSDYQAIKGHSDKLMRLFALMDRVRDHDFSVLIVGESGTGKELVARAIHYTGSRSEGPFVAINCGALPESLLESELFGHVKGAFTGAVANRRGLFEQADGGTLFLDEIGEMPAAMQVKLLRVLQSGEFSPVGGTETLSVDVRILGATHRDLEKLVEDEAFREDLLYRLRVVDLHVPPLRARREDISVLVEHFIGQNRNDGIGAVTRVTPRALKTLTNHSWPGNIRELEMFIKSACVFADGDTLDLVDVASLLDRGTLRAVSTDSYEGTLADVERQIIEQRLTQYEGNKSQTAQSLGIDRGTLYNKIRSWKS
ncbi:MAG TPA: hypothetical protein DCQ06_11325 [Myxococcales bacterium]|nr:hypothetical protein [Myxococcales bacterium]